MSIPSLPCLRILPIEKIILHEDHDNQRTLPLVEKLRAQGIIRNPPIVMPLNDDSGRYMVLDGANRVTALQELEFPHIVAQVAEPHDRYVHLQTWNHVTWGMKTKSLLAALKKIKGLELVKINPRKSLEAPKYKPVQLRLPDGSLYMLKEAPSELDAHIHTLNQIVDTYKKKASLDRTSQTLIEPFTKIYPTLTALIIFPGFKIKTVLKLASQNITLPTGITRFTVSPRALHLNYPLHELSSGKPLEYKQRYLDSWIEERVKKKGARYYAESTFLFDE
ncbi:MAG: ParB N-terminal domain-containing protein [Anaerolineales bacterium]|nr:ParB N-terminal domain-containing protein [Anaerolineales bacterium]